MKFTYFLVLVLIMLSFVANGQRQGKKKDNNSAANLPLSERIYFGGGGGFSSGIHPNGYRYNYIAVNPLVGYRITLPWSAGLGVSYQTYRFPDVGARVDQYGLSPFTQYRFGKLFGYAELSGISVQPLNSPSRRIYKRLPVGIGYSLPIGNRAAINAMALYDVIYRKSDLAFASPWILRVFITAGGISF